MEDVKRGSGQEKGFKILNEIKNFFQSKQLSSGQVEELVKEGIEKGLSEMPKALTQINSWSLYDGEKNPGEIGPAIDYEPNYNKLRVRSWQAYLDSELAQTVIKRFVVWMIGTGLKPQSEPALDALKSEGINLSVEQSHEFSKLVEARFNVFRRSKYSDYSRMRNLNSISKKALKEMYVGGDSLVVLRYDKGFVNVQLIDGAHVQSPLFGTDYYPHQLKNGNKISNGVEYAPNGEHVCFYVKNSYGTYDIIPAYGENSGIQMAFMIYGFEYRLDSTRGMPLLSVVFETLKKLERYKEAAVGSAEERQKIPYVIEHGVGSTGENILLQDSIAASGFGEPKKIDSAEIKNLQKAIKVTTNKQAINMPVDSALKAIETKSELYFKDFYSVNINLLCACVGIPPDVAMSKYDSNFSASRAALKDWENTLNVGRDDFSMQFYQPIYNFWLLVEVLNGKIKAPGFVEAFYNENQMVLESYRTVRFVGTPVPHIDPEKEVNAERAKLGVLGAHMPLTTVEAATEALNGGESSSNISQFSDEIQKAEGLGIKAPVINAPVDPPKNKDNKKD